MIHTFHAIPIVFYEFVFGPMHAAHGLRASEISPGVERRT